MKDRLNSVNSEQKMAHKSQDTSLLSTVPLEEMGRSYAVGTKTKLSLTKMAAIAQRRWAEAVTAKMEEPRT